MSRIVGCISHILKIVLTNTNIQELTFFHLTNELEFLKFKNSHELLRETHLNKKSCSPLQNERNTPPMRTIATAIFFILHPVPVPSQSLQHHFQKPLLFFYFIFIFLYPVHYDQFCRFEPLLKGHFIILYKFQFPDPTLVIGVVQ